MAERCVDGRARPATHTRQILNLFSPSPSSRVSLVHPRAPEPRREGAHASLPHDLLLHNFLPSFHRVTHPPSSPPVHRVLHA